MHVFKASINETVLLNWLGGAGGGGGGGDKKYFFATFSASTPAGEGDGFFIGCGGGLVSTLSSLSSTTSLCGGTFVASPSSLIDSS